MDAAKIMSTDWYQELSEQVQAALERTACQDVAAKPSLQAELQRIRDQQAGWRQTLGNKDLNPRIRAAIEGDWESSINREAEIETQLAEQAGRDQLVCDVLDPVAIAKRLDRLSDVLTASSPTLGNIELSMHIDRIDCFHDGHVVMRTCKLGLLGDIGELVADDAMLPVPLPVTGVQPRRRSRRRTQILCENDDELRSIAFAAADPGRFAGLPEQWFWADTFEIPGRNMSWAAANAEAVFKRRQESKLSFGQLAKEFLRTKPTVRAAVQSYLQQHPDEVDVVKLRPGGNDRRSLTSRRSATRRGSCGTLAGRRNGWLKKSSDVRHRPSLRPSPNLTLGTACRCRRTRNLRKPKLQRRVSY
jgi:hypothetical protein